MIEYLVERITHFKKLHSMIIIGYKHFTVEFIYFNSVIGIRKQLFVVLLCTFFFYKCITMKIIE